jgi:2-hydroxychromene-2-carboxylate isomerase
VIFATLYNDPACPWGYSANPALSVLRWRYRDAIEWRLRVISLREESGGDFTPARQARSSRYFRDRYGMPFAARPKERPIPTGRACRAIVATAQLHPGREIAAMRALQFAWFNTAELLDQDEAIERTLARVAGIDAAAVIAALDTDEVSAAYTADKAAARSAAGGATDFQGKAARDGELVRYTAPSVVFEHDGQRLEVGGFQPLEAYDVAIANLDRSIERHSPPDGPLPLLEHFTDGLCTQEVAALLAGNLVQPDRAAAEDALIELAAVGEIVRQQLGDDALWIAPSSQRRRHAQLVGASATAP